MKLKEKLIVYADDPFTVHLIKQSEQEKLINNFTKRLSNIYSKDNNKLSDGSRKKIKRMEQYLKRRQEQIINL